MRKRRVFMKRSNCVSGVTNCRNRPGTLKQCAMAHENDQNMRKRRVLTTRSNRVSGVTGPSILAWETKTVCYSRNGQTMRKRPVLTTRSTRVPGVTKSGNRPGTLKLCAIAHENGQNMRKRRILTTRSNRVPGVTNSGDRVLDPRYTKTVKTCENDEF